MKIEIRHTENRTARRAWSPALLATLALVGCGSPAETGTGGNSGSGGGGTGGAGGSAGGAGGGGAGGSSGKEPPDYGKAFPQDEVPRLDITITPESWQAAVADMTDMVGEFGSGTGVGGPGGQPTAEQIAACDGLAEGDACTASIAGMDIAGTCSTTNGQLACTPSGGPGGPGGEPTAEQIAACDGLAEGDSCVATIFGMDITGTCSPFEAQLACMPSGDPGGGGPGGGGGVELLPRDPIYIECDVKHEDREWYHVGIRFKGNSSLAQAWQQGIWKLPLRLSFDKFEDTYPETTDQRFYGFKSLSLSNSSMDSSFLRDKLGTEVFVRAGIPAPATAFYRIFIDHGEGPKYFGLYTAIEVPSDKSFLESHFGEDGEDGNLYKPEGVGAQWATFDTETLGKQNHEAEADFSDAQALFDALHADKSDAAAFRAGLEKQLDVDAFLHWLALNTVAQDWDTYGRMSHNYYLYSNTASGVRFTWIPWDHTFAFSSQNGVLSLSLDEVTDQWPLIRYLLDDPVYREAYRGHVAKAAESEYEPVWATARFQEAHDLIAPYVIGLEGELPGYTFVTSEAAFEGTVAELQSHVNKRQTDVANYLQQ